ncbi:GNAT family N-acetyltransferase [Paractinoplanes atraurantiacus]|uniref:Acetyltransferase (GNAT) family protein n=1 Tax=Paractinoplanes atraurantiacus TaxID=1036182 RepID=A0A285JA05_9ACTN|nr:GNAT family N-acetyltransferase [Actinoplanes atraurantiacus]SNY57068.1 Acetyltransferase (GNAT) family protein [Actinoplanes atraurantiacus]
MPSDIVRPTAAHLAPLFDEYRAHYGEAPFPARTTAWLEEHLTSGRLTAYAAGDSGFITVAIQPASLRLATAWMIRDLYVRPAGRRRGTARALLRHVIVEARTAGALRVSLQTETDNAGALALYGSLGFRPVTGLELLNLTLS